MEVEVGQCCYNNERPTGQKLTYIRWDDGGKLKGKLIQLKSSHRCKNMIFKSIDRPTTSSPNFCFKVFYYHCNYHIIIIIIIIYELRAIHIRAAVPN